LPASSLKTVVVATDPSRFAETNTPFKVLPLASRTNPAMEFGEKVDTVNANHIHKNRATIHSPPDTGMSSLERELINHHFITR
jgi:hypothetical protein